MRINGLWRLCDDGVTRPIIRGKLEAGDGTHKWAEFLVDVGADRTVLNAATVTEAAALEINVLGRDILDLFAVIIDRPGDAVCLLSQRHRYTIIQE